jgi:hypothetical protein
MKAQMRGFLLGAERNQAHLIGLAHFFKRPANARIARQASAAIGRPVKSGDDDGHLESRRLAGTVYAEGPEPNRKLIAGPRQPS